MKTAMKYKTVVKREKVLYTYEYLDTDDIDNYFKNNDTKFNTFVIKTENNYYKRDYNALLQFLEGRRFSSKEKLVAFLENKHLSRFNSHEEWERKQQYMKDIREYAASKGLNECCTYQFENDEEKFIATIFIRDNIADNKCELHYEYQFDNHYDIFRSRFLSTFMTVDEILEKYSKIEKLDYVMSDPIYRKYVDPRYAQLPRRGYIYGFIKYFIAATPEDILTIRQVGKKAMKCYANFMVNYAREHNVEIDKDWYNYI